MPAITNDRDTAGPACVAATTPVSTKMPTPMSPPRPMLVSCHRPSTRRNCPARPISDWSCSIDLVRKSACSRMYFGCNGQNSPQEHFREDRNAPAGRTGTPNRLDKPGIAWVGFDLLAQPHHLGVDTPVGSSPFPALDEVDQLIPDQHTSGMAGEGA